MKRATACLIALSIAACTTTPTNPKFQTAGTKPINAERLVRSWLDANLKDPYSVRDLKVSEVRQGTFWSGLIHQGAVPSWYVCAGYNAKNSYGAYTGYDVHVLWIRDSSVFSESKAETQTLHSYRCNSI